MGLQACGWGGGAEVVERSRNIRVEAGECLEKAYFVP
jgi:hypothetical protein